MAQVEPSDTGFGYISSNSLACHHIEIPIPPASLRKSTMRVPDTPGGEIDNPICPTVREEQLLDKYEQGTEKEQAKDLKIKIRVRVAKFILRSINFSCSLIILVMLSATFSIFNATEYLAPRNNFQPWAQGQKTWPQITVLIIACISLAFCLLIFWNYWRGGHRKAEKVAIYSTLFAVGFFIFNIVMWAIAAAILQHSKSSGHGKDIWGWSCIENYRSELFQEVNYTLICKMQNWSLVCCLIEIMLDCITFILYGIIFYRYYSKQRLRKSMDVRDRARSDFYLALQPPSIESQSATPRIIQKGLESAPFPHVERRIGHVSAASGRQTYDAVPIPGAYSSPLSNPGLAQTSHH